MKSNKEQKTKVLCNKGLKKFNRLRYYYKKLKIKSGSSGFLITLCTIVIIPFLNNLPSEVTIFNNVTQHNIQTINISSDNER